MSVDLYSNYQLVTKAAVKSIETTAYKALWGRCRALQAL